MGVVRTGGYDSGTGKLAEIDGSDGTKLAFSTDSAGAPHVVLTGPNGQKHATQRQPTHILKAANAHTKMKLGVCALVTRTRAAFDDCNRVNDALWQQAIDDCNAGRDPSYP